MHQPSRRNLLGLAALTPLAGGLLAGGSAVADPTATTQTPATPRQRIRQRYFPNVVLRTQDNQEVRFYDDLIKDRVVTINFFFAKCEEICPIVTANLSRVQRLLGDKIGRDIFMNSISLKPQDDTPAKLKAYAEMHKALPGWTFLTGDPKDIETLRRSLGFTNPDVKLDQDVNQHIGNIRYGNEPLMLWAACPGQARPEWIAESVNWMIRPETKAAIAAG
jgi:protein SCO1/2